MTDQLPITAATKLRRRRWPSLLIGTVVAVVAVVFLFGLQNKIHIVRLDEMFSPRYGFPVGFREQYFEQSFPKPSEIEAYLANSTILHSAPPIGNDVYYFGEDRDFVLWRNVTIESGTWRSSSIIQIILLGSRWRIAAVSVFCMTFFNRNKVEQQDNCSAVVNLESILARGPNVRREHRKGNVFGLMPNNQPPGRLPNTDITIDSLSSMRPNNRSN